MHNTNTMLEALQHEHRLCACNNGAIPSEDLTHDDNVSEYDVMMISNSECGEQQTKGNTTMMSSVSLSSVISPSTECDDSQKPPSMIFHRKIQSEDNHVIKAAFTTKR